MKAALVLALALAAGPVIAHGHRSHAAISHFKHANACPSTGQRGGRCPGYVIDHVRPLCAGGADAPSNMAWQTVADAKVKDRSERAQCRRR